MTATGPRYARYVLALLLAAYALSSFDRSIVNLLLEPIRIEFGASDTQLGLFSGPAFALFYSTLAIPIAALADRWHRRNVIVLSVLLWTVMTALCGLAGSFMALVIARAGVAVGQSGASPASHSLLADYFPAGRRATALGVYTLGAATGSTLAGLAGGWGPELLGWRGTMLVAAAPGALVAMLLAFTVTEPSRTTSGARADCAPLALSSVVRHLWSCRSLRHLYAGCALHSLAMYCSSSFNPAYLARSHGWHGPEIGQLVAMLGVTGLAGTFLGGFLADRLSSHFGDARWQMWVPGIATVLVIPVQLLCYLGSGAPMVVAFALSSLLSLVYFGSSYATVQSLAPPQMRAVAASLLLFAKAIVGMGLGPLLVGMWSDRLYPLLGEQSLRFALLLVPLFNVWATVHFLRGARHLRADMNVTPATPMPELVRATARS